MNPTKSVILVMAGIVLVGALDMGKSVVDRAVDFIIPFEGFSATPYWDVHQWSIGYGTRVGTDPGNKPSVVWTTTQARDALFGIVSSDYQQLLQMVTRTLSSSQWVALLSFAYNLGVSGSSAIIDRINAGKSLSDIAAAMRLYVYADGVVNDYLVNRRDREAALFIA